MSKKHVENELSGGPGSQKGVATQELIAYYDFVSINVEDIVLSYLPNKVRLGNGISEVKKFDGKRTNGHTRLWRQTPGIAPYLEPLNQNNRSRCKSSLEKGETEMRRFQVSNTVTTTSDIQELLSTFSLFNFLVFVFRS